MATGGLEPPASELRVLDLSSVSLQFNDLEVSVRGERFAMCRPVLMGADVELADRDSIASALHHIAELIFQRLPLVSATDRPAGVISFRDIAAYIETSFSI